MSNIPSPALAQRLLNNLLTIIQSRNNATTITRFKALLQLDKVDNTRDIEKPLSNSTITAILTGDVDGQRETQKTHVQNVASDTWLISHNLQKNPHVSVTTPDGEEVMGDVRHLDDVSLTISFSVPLTGEAYLS